MRSTGGGGGMGRLVEIIQVERSRGVKWSCVPAADAVNINLNRAFTALRFTVSFFCDVSCLVS